MEPYVLFLVKKSYIFNVEGNLFYYTDKQKIGRYFYYSELTYIILYLKFTEKRCQYYNDIKMETLIVVIYEEITTKQVMFLFHYTSVILFVM